MANVYLLNLSESSVTLGNVFDSSRIYITKDPVQPNPEITYTKTLKSPSLRIYQETYQGILYNAYADLSKRRALGPAVPITGPFIENYSVDGDVKTDNFINLLLLDKQPIRTGFFKFTIGDVSFTGIIRQLTKYIHYDWELSGTEYYYKQKLDSLGYAIEISKNLLYTATTDSNNNIIYIPTALNLFLRNLTGNEIIFSSASIDNPNSYLSSIPGANSKISGSLPINIFYISEEDALRYIASYQDLIISFGTNYAKGQEHYAKFGALENRIISFNPIAYLNKYSDLRSAYGYDTKAATIHYITTGYYEGRILDQASTYNPLTGGLYDSRITLALTTNSIIWPTNAILRGKGRGLTYRYNDTLYNINSAVDFQSNTIFLKAQ